MQVLSPRVDLNAFYDRLAGAGERVLMLDYDGTLAPFRTRPEQAVPYQGVVEALRALIVEEGTRVVIVSGRRAEEVAALLPAGIRPEIWGAHGWERLVPGRDVQAEVPAAEVQVALAEANLRAADFRQTGGRVECKPASVALHWRGLPLQTVARLRDRSEAAWRPLAVDGIVEWLPFDGGVELRARGVNKQHAVKTVLSETGSATPVAYLGDDITDEDAFRAVRMRGLAVLVRPEFRETVADLWIRPPHELLEFLGHWRRSGPNR
jgi:trehalose 6-phosphate phosphatase